MNEIEAVACGGRRGGQALLLRELRRGANDTILVLYVKEYLKVARNDALGWFSMCDCESGLVAGKRDQPWSTAENG